MSAVSEIRRDELHGIWNTGKGNVGRLTRHSGRIGDQNDMPIPENEKTPKESLRCRSISFKVSVTAI
jgi:hypothetical protein